MLSIELIRKDPDYVRQALTRRGENAPIEEIVNLDQRRRQCIVEADALKAHRNTVSKNLGRKEEERSDSISEMRIVGSQISGLDQEIKMLGQQLQSMLLVLPNLPNHGVPDGTGEADNVTVRNWGQPRSFPFTPLPHWELGEKLNIIDFQRGAKLAGSRFFVLTNYGARLERALVNWMLDIHVQNHGYNEVHLPALARQEIMVGSGNLPKFADNLYHDSEDDLWLIPTAEVPLTNLHRDEILPPGTLPLMYTASTPCFRREKAAAGRDTRGIKRVHQFTKVELYKLVEPHSSGEELLKLVSDAEKLCQLLEIPHRVVHLCSFELGFASAESYDLEMWAPGSAEWLEVSSCSNCSDFQARRANLRHRSSEGASPTFVHTLNGSGLALPRVIIAILENGQRADGSVAIPSVLHPYTGFEIIEAA